MERQRSVARLTGGCMVLLLTVAGCAFVRGYMPSAAPPPDAAALLRVRLPTPRDAKSRDYLGLDAAGTLFSLADIRAEVIVLEIFDMYCAYCQKAAPTVREFFNLLQKRGYAERVKLMGVGKHNTQFEVSAFQEEYELAFPLFPDPRRTIVNQLPHDATPYFYIIQRLPDGSLRLLERRRGGFPDAAEFLDAILTSAGMEANSAAPGQNQNMR